jgi:hypothetical protein
MGGTFNNRIFNEICEQKDRNPNAFIANETSGYFCSRALKDEMNAIVGYCKPYEN